jgi:molecular chaperone Hsp33
VQLEDRVLARDLLRWFAASEQVATALDLAVVPRGEEPLGEVGGILVQLLPGGDQAVVDGARRRIEEGAFREALARGGTAQEMVRAVAGEGFELLADLEVAYRCGCSAGRARAAVSALGAQGVRDVIEKDGQAVITCEFCRSRYVVSEAELRDIAARLEDPSEG